LPSKSGLFGNSLADRQAARLDDPKDTAERRQATVVFSDLVG
jgi:hypothetical protein